MGVVWAAWAKGAEQAGSFLGSSSTNPNHAQVKKGGESGSSKSERYGTLEPSTCNRPKTPCPTANSSDSAALTMCKGFSPNVTVRHCQGVGPHIDLAPTPAKRRRSVGVKYTKRGTPLVVTWHVRKRHQCFSSSISCRISSLTIRTG